MSAVRSTRCLNDVALSSGLSNASDTQFARMNNSTVLSNHRDRTTRSSMNRRTSVQRVVEPSTDAAFDGGGNSCRRRLASVRGISGCADGLSLLLPGEDAARTRHAHDRTT